MPTSGAQAWGGVWIRVETFPPLKATSSSLRASMSPPQAQGGEAGHRSCCVTQRAPQRGHCASPLLGHTLLPRTRGCARTGRPGTGQHAVLISPPPIFGPGSAPAALDSTARRLCSPAAPTALQSGTPPPPSPRAFQHRRDGGAGAPMHTTSSAWSRGTPSPSTSLLNRPQRG